MEDIVQFLIIAAFIAITVVGKANKKKKETEEETYPEFPDDLKDEEDDAVEVRTYTRPEMFIPAPKPVVNKHKNKRNNKKQPKEPEVAAAPSIAVTPQSESVTDLRSPRKAREAFIHSIIFERKYQ